MMRHFGARVDIRRLFQSEAGRFLASIILGFGLASIFRKACTDRNCIQFNGPVISEVNGKTYQFGDLCYKYKLEPVKCSSTKKQVDLSDGIKDRIAAGQSTSGATASPASPDSPPPSSSVIESASFLSSALKSQNYSSSASTSSASAPSAFSETKST